MLSRRTLLAVAVMFAAGAFAVPAHAADKLKALIIDGQNNHNWKATTPVIRQALENSGRFTVDVSTSPDKKAGTDEQWAAWRPQFKAYDVVVSNYNGQRWPKPVEEAFVEYVKNGGGLVILHAANNSFGDWEEYNKMIGLGGWGGRNEKSGPYVYFKDGKFVRDTSEGRGGAHGSQHPFKVTIREPEHPITKGMPAEWMHAKDELYDRLRGPAENMTVLATSYSDPAHKGAGRHEPMIMVLDYGKGRVFHTPMGHADYSMKCLGFQVTTARGAEWAATGKVTIPIPDNFPTDEVVEASGEPYAAAPAITSNPQRWKETIDKWVEQDKQSPPKKDHVLFVGSSSIRMWKTDEYFPALKPINRGFGGSQLEDVLYYVDKIVLPYEPHTIVLYEGDNDIAKGKSPQRVFDDWKKFAETVHSRLPKTRIVFIAIKPSIKRWDMVDKMREANKLIAEHAATDDRLAFADIDTPMLGDDGKPRQELFLKDNLHLSHEGYVIWTKVVGKLIKDESTSKN